MRYGVNATFPVEGKILAGGLEGRRRYQSMALPANLTGICTAALAQMAGIAIMHNLIQQSN